MIWEPIVEQFDCSLHYHTWSLLSLSRGFVVGDILLLPVRSSIRRNDTSVSFPRLPPFFPFMSLQFASCPSFSFFCAGGGGGHIFPHLAGLCAWDMHFFIAFLVQCPQAWQNIKHSENPWYLRNLNRVLSSWRWKQRREFCEIEKNINK